MSTQPITVQSVTRRGNTVYVTYTLAGKKYRLTLQPADLEQAAAARREDV